MESSQSTAETTTTAKASSALSGTKRRIASLQPGDEEQATPPTPLRRLKKRTLPPMTAEALTLRRQATKWLHLVVHADKWVQESHYLMPRPKDLPQHRGFVILYGDDDNETCPVSKMIHEPPSRGSENNEDEEEGDWGDWMKEHMNAVGGFDLEDPEASSDPDYPAAIQGVFHYEM